VVDWSAVFDEAYPEAGASDFEIQRLTNTVGQPLSATEVAEVIALQQNPFPPDDLLHRTWRPCDPTRWTVPSRPLPALYLDFMRWSNGGEFRTGERWFQFFPALDRRLGIRAILLAYLIPEFMPGALPFAFNGNGTFYLFDMREAAARGEYPIVCSCSGNLELDRSACVRIADTFLDACQGRVAVEELLFFGP
jgi:hypothetical protein